MPAHSIEKIRQAEAGLKQKVADAGDDHVKRRAAAKALRRAQRKRRKMDAIVAKHAPKPKAAESADGGGDGGEA